MIIFAVLLLSIFHNAYSADLSRPAKYVYWGSINFFSGDSCSVDTYLEQAFGPDNGLCTQFPYNDFGSFQVIYLDDSCGVTIYGDDIPYCSSNTKSLAQLGQCYTNQSVNQFSVDCQLLVLSTANLPQLTTAPTTLPTASTTPHQSAHGLSTGAEVGISVSSICGFLILSFFVYVAWRFRRRLVAPRKTTTTATTPELALGDKDLATELSSGKDAVRPVETGGKQIYPELGATATRPWTQELQGSQVELVEVEGDLGKYHSNGVTNQAHEVDVKVRSEASAGIDLGSTTMVDSSSEVTRNGQTLK